MSTNKTFTENLAPTHSTSNDSRVDFFFHVIEDAELEKTVDLLSKSWSTHPLDTLKLVAFLRDCRHGKGIRRQYQMCLLWLFRGHYKTLYENLEQFVSFGYWKDLMLLLMVLLFDGHIPEYLAKDDSSKSKTGVTIDSQSRAKKSKIKFPIYDRLLLRGLQKEIRQRKKEEKLAKKSAQNNQKSDQNKENKVPVITDDKKSSKGESSGTNEEEAMQKISKTSEKIEEIRRKFAQNHYEKDEKYRNLYDRIVQIFAKQLKTDLENMAKQNKSISLAGKWTPSNGHHFDKYLLISKSISIELCKLFEKQDIIANHDLVLKYYQTEVCAPLRRFLKIPEVYMAANHWNDIDYSRVAAKCMQKNKSAFIKHDKDRFEAYLTSKKTIAGATLKPIELVERCFQLLHGVHTDEEELEKQVLEKQWLSLCEDIKKKGGGLLDNAIAICDVSGSMSGVPMNAAIGLTILVAQLTSPPWNSLCITFSEVPEFHVLNPEDTFINKLQSIQGMSWGMNTDLNAVFKLILENAIKHRLSSEQIPKLLLVFTDMEFDSAFPGTTLTNFEAAEQQFANFGYKLPPIAFWNLRSDTKMTSTPVESNEMGVFLLSGYSGQQLSLILKSDDFSKITPMAMMRQAIDNERYSKLQVLD